MKDSHESSSLLFVKNVVQGSYAESGIHGIVNSILIKADLGHGWSAAREAESKYIVRHKIMRFEILLEEVNGMISAIASTSVNPELLSHVATYMYKSRYFPARATAGVDAKGVFYVKKGPRHRQAHSDQGKDQRKSQLCLVACLLAAMSDFTNCAGVKIEPWMVEPFIAKDKCRGLVDALESCTGACLVDGIWRSEE